MSNVIDPLQKIKSKVHQQVLSANQEYVSTLATKEN